MTLADRVQRAFWYADKENGVVRPTIGYSTHDADVWWCPDTGCSLTIGFAIFDTKQSARYHVQLHLVKIMADAQRKLDRL